MRKKQIALLTVIVGLVCQPLSAQFQSAPPDPETAKALKERDERIAQITEQSLAEVSGLRLPGNRAVLYGLAGDIYWRLDQERSRQLFRSAAAEIQAHYQEAAVARANQPASGIASVVNPIPAR